MALGTNDSLITTADSFNVTFNNINNSYDTLDYDATGQQAVAFVFGDGITGDDTIENFGKNDSIINFKKIFDGNNDGIISFGPNGQLDIDRTGAGNRNAGEAQITISNGEQNIDALRYLGTKGNGTGHAYADASTRLAGMTEGTVGNDTSATNAAFDAATGAKTYLYDTALGLNLGGDTISNFGADDRIVTTTKIHNGPDMGAVITFGTNRVLDLPGDTDGIKGDNGPTHGGQIEFVTPGIDHLSLLDTKLVGGVNYYYYGVTPGI